MAKNNAELRAVLNMVEARLNGDPKTASDWAPIVNALAEAKRYAVKVHALRLKLEDQTDLALRLAGESKVR